MVVSANESSRYCICFPKKVNVEDVGQLNSCKKCYLRIPDEKAIYMVFKDINRVRHVGTKGLGWKKYIVKNIIQEQIYRPGVGGLIQTYGMEAVISTIQTLSESSVFTSHLAAMRRFPDLDRVMPTGYRDDDEPSEESGAYCETVEEATEEKTDLGPEEATKTEPCDDWPCEPDVEEKEDSVATEPQPEATEDKPCTDSDITPSPNNTPTSDATTEEDEELKPADPEQNIGAQKDCDKAPEDLCKDMDSNTALLPFSSLYELLMGLQKYLERACFTYGRRKMPAILSQNNWDCAEAVPLEHWMREFLNQSEIFSTKANTENLESLFRRLCKVQEITSQRIRVQSDVLRELLKDACELMHVLGDSEYRDLTRELRSNIEKTLKDIQHKNISYRNRRDEKLQQIESERAKLDKLEKMIRDEMDRDVRERQAMAKVEVRKALGKAAVTFETEIEWKEEKTE